MRNRSLDDVCFEIYRLQAEKARKAIDSWPVWLREGDVIAREALAELDSESPPKRAQFSEDASAAA